MRIAKNALKAWFIVGNSARGANLTTCVRACTEAIPTRKEQDGKIIMVNYILGWLRWIHFSTPETPNLSAKTQKPQPSEV